MKLIKKGPTDITEISFTMDTYVIVHSLDGMVGMDYTTNLAEFLDLLTWHEKYSDSWDVYKIKTEVKK
jgi:hypothetical protein